MWILTLSAPDVVRLLKWPGVLSFEGRFYHLFCTEGRVQSMQCCIDVKHHETTARIDKYILGKLSVCYLASEQSNE